MTEAIPPLASLLGWSPDPTEILQAGVAGLRSALGSDLLGIASLGQGEEENLVFDDAGLPAEVTRALRALPLVRWAAYQQALEAGRPVCLAAAHHPGAQRTILEAAGIRHLAVTPLLSRGRVLGALGVGLLDRALAECELEYLGTIGTLLGPALRETAAYRGAECCPSDAELKRRLAERTTELLTTNASLEHEIADRQRMENALREQVRLASFAAGIGAALTQAEDLDDALRRCAEAMVRHLDAGAAHIWIVEPGRQLPALRASAGVEVEAGLRPCHAISAIAQARRPHVTQSVQDDPLTRDARWATRRGLVAFAGYPLSVEDQVVGVMTLLSERPFPEATLNALAGVASQLALGFTRKLASDALRATHADLERRVQQRTSALLEEIAERKRAEEELRESREQLRQLAAKLERVREEERTRIAREIHDELGQALTAVKLDLSSLKRLCERKGSRKGSRQAHPDALLERLGAMASLVDQTVQIVRRISTELRPAVLDSLGLAAAVEWQAQDFERRTDIRCVFRSTLDEEPIAREVATAAFRILQETLTNVARHAEAGWVAVNLGLEDQAWLALDVTDDGRGISKEALASSKSIGLAGMRERALLLGGHVQVEGRPGQGTTVRVRLPVSRPKEGGVR